MSRHIFIAIASFLVGAVLTTVIRTSRHQPYAPVATMSPVPVAVSTPQMTSMPEPTATTVQSAAPVSATPVPAAPASPVNTICAICGMPVNSAIPTAEYHGKVIGFGCKTCPARFAKEPDKFGPAALTNHVVEDK